MERLIPLHEFFRYISNRLDHHRGALLVFR
jgi:hypothetical protein